MARRRSPASSPAEFRATRPGRSRNLRGPRDVRKVITRHPKGAAERNSSPASCGTKPPFRITPIIRSFDSEERMILTQDLPRIRDSDFGPGARATPEKMGARIEKLPCGAARKGEKWEHPILENSTACTMSNAKYPSAQLWLGRGFLWKTFKQQSKSVMICSVSFKLAVLSPIPVGCCK